MTQPTSPRFEGIKEKLEYADAQRVDLTKALLGSYEGDRPLPQFLRQTAENILAHARECFDHLGVDLIEQHLLPHAESEFVANYHSGKAAHYFPFFMSQLNNPKNAFQKLRQLNPVVFSEVEKFIGAIDAKSVLSNTIFKAHDFRVLREMVNDKKHSRVIEYKVVADQNVYAKGPAGMVVMERAQFDVPGIRIGEAFGGRNPKLVPAYRFANGKDILDFCLFSTRATAVVMNNFYKKLFIVDGSIDLDAFQRRTGASS